MAPLTTKIMKQFYYILLALAVCPPLACEAVESDVPLVARKLVVTRAETPPVIDGRLDDLCWKLATVARDFSIAEDSQQFHPEQSVGRVCFDEDNIYISMECTVNELDKFKARLAAVNGEFKYGYGGVIEVFIDANHDKKSFQQCLLHANGTSIMTFTEGDVFLTLNKTYLVSRSQLTDKGYNVEMSFPLAMLHLHPDTAEIWGFNLNRAHDLYDEDVDTNGLFSSWNPTKGMAFGSPELFGELVMKADFSRFYWKVDFVSEPLAGDSKVQLRIKNETGRDFSGRLTLDLVSTEEKAVAYSKTISLSSGQEKIVSFKHFISAEEVEAKYKIKITDKLGRVCYLGGFKKRDTIFSDYHALIKTFAPTPPGWWRGNLHTHTLWSDGNGYPEIVADWYKQHGYHFLALSDHNILSQGEKWIDATKNVKNKDASEALQEYRESFGDDWVEQRVVQGKVMVRLKPLSEFRHLFEEPGRFMMIQSEEISDVFGTPPTDIHINATNLRNLIPPQKGNSVFEVMQNNVNAVLAQRRETGQAMFPHINHPNGFLWRFHDPKFDNRHGITAQDIAKLQGERFFEVHNGCPGLNNHGDSQHIGTERLWDIILTLRLAELKGEIIYGLGVDDAHQHHRGSDRFDPGTAWVVVRSKFLTPESIIRAMEAGDFYASTGVVLKDIQFDSKTINIQIQPEDGISYTTQFVGTLKGYDHHSKPVLNQAGKPIPQTRRYSKDIGVILSEVKGISPQYTLAGNEIYIRAKVISTKPNKNPSDEKLDRMEVAWTQPVVPGSINSKVAETK
jgi:hypothetical protein